METKEDGLAQIKTGIKLIKTVLKAIDKPASKTSMKELKASLALLSKKAKMLEKDEKLRVQYLDRTAFDTIQGVFQALHLFIVSSDKYEPVDEAIVWLRTYENCYSISDRMRAAAEARADFATGAKK